MDVLYIPQLDEGGAGESPTAGRYRLLKRVPEEGCVALTDRAVTRVEVTSARPLRLVVPPLVKGAVRDFFVRIVITADEVPEVTFAAPAGETLSFEDVDEDVFKCELGVNVFAFTETDQGAFIVNRKRVDIDVEVAFDACGGEVDSASRAYKLGAQYSSLPVPRRAGYTFAGWFTEPEGGVEARETDCCKSGVTRLYARWSVFEDAFADYICPSKNVTFLSDGPSPWLADTTVYATARGSARSGSITHGGSTSLTATVSGKGILSFKWRVSSELNYDKLCLVVDGAVVADISGERGWSAYALDLGTGGLHEIEWKYVKDGSVSTGSDCGWVDEVAWIPTED